MAYWFVCYLEDADYILRAEAVEAATPLGAAVKFLEKHDPGDYTGVAARGGCDVVVQEADGPAARGTIFHMEADFQISYHATKREKWPRGEG